MIRGRASMVLLVALMVVFGVAPATTAAPAGGGGGETVEFDLDGTLPEFPCPQGCPVTFEGSGTGGGNLTTMIDGVTHNATFTVLSGDVSGSAIYNEPGFPFCPLIGSASSPTTGSVTLSGGAAGVIFRTTPLIPSGSVHTVSVTLDFSYQRVGATPTIEITGGSITAEYFIPGTGSGSFTQQIAAGAGGGVFEVNPIEAFMLCQNPGELDFRIVGDAAVVTQEPVLP